MSIIFNTNGSIACNSLNAGSTNSNIKFNPNYDIDAKKIYIEPSLSSPNFDTSYGLHCSGITSGAASNNFKLDNQAFSDIFEAAYGTFETVSFTGLSPAQTFLKANYYDTSPNDSYYYNGSLVDVAGKGTKPSNTRITYKTTAGKWMIIQQHPSGFSITVDGTTTVYSSTSRGTYPIKRLGLIFSGGGGGGAGADLILDNSQGESSIEPGIVTRIQNGGGGGGAGLIACVLKLDAISSFGLYLGAGGAKGTNGVWNSSLTSYTNATAGSQGTDSYLRAYDGRGALLATAGGGAGGQLCPNTYTQAPGGVGGGTYYDSSSSFFQLKNSLSGGTGGKGGFLSKHEYATSITRQYLATAGDDKNLSGNFCNTSDTQSAYDYSISGNSYSRISAQSASYSHSNCGGGGGGCQLASRYSGGQGGNGGIAKAIYNPDQTYLIEVLSSGLAPTAGSDGFAWFFY